MSQVSVLPEPPEPDDTNEERVPVGSPEHSLAQRAASARKKRYLQRAVPGYEPPILVRFRALEPEEIDKIHKRFRKLPVVEQAKKGAAATLIEACLGIFDDVEGKLLSIDRGDEDCFVNDDDEIEGTPVRFGDERLAEQLEVEPGSAEREVFGLYAVKGDVIQAGNAVLEFSGVGDKDVEDLIRGNS